MRKLIVFLYFVFLFKLAFAQSLPSFPGFGSLSEIEPAAGNVQMAQNSAEIPMLGEEQGDDSLPADFDLPVSDATPAEEVPAEFEAPAVDEAAVNTGSTTTVAPAEVTDIPTLPDQNTAPANAAGDDTNIEKIISDDSVRDQFPATPELGFENRKAEDAAAKSAAPVAPELTAEDRENEVNNLLDQVFDKEKTPEQIAKEKAEQEAEEQAAAVENKAKQDDSPLTENIVDIDDKPIESIDDLTSDEEDFSDLGMPDSMREPSVLAQQLSNTGRVGYSSSTYSEQKLADLLVKAAMVGDVNSVNELLHSGRNINSQNIYGESALMGAVYNSHNGIVSTLISEGADVNIVDNKGNSPLLVAAAKNNTQAIQELIRAGADIDLANNASDTPLLVAVLNNNVDVANTLVRQGADINKPNADGLTALHIASYNGNADIVGFLLSKGANPNLVARGGYKPYDLAKNKSQAAASIISSYVESQQKAADQKIANEINQRTSKEFVSTNITPAPVVQTTKVDQYSMVPSAYKEKVEQAEQQPAQSDWWAAKQTPVASTSSAPAAAQSGVQKADYSSFENGGQKPASIAYSEAGKNSSASSDEKKWTKLTADQNTAASQPQSAPAPQAPNIMTTTATVTLAPVVPASAPKQVAVEQKVSTPVAAPAIPASAPAATPVAAAAPQQIMRARYDNDGHLINAVPVASGSTSTPAPAPAAQQSSWQNPDAKISTTPVQAATITPAAPVQPASLAIKAAAPAALAQQQANVNLPANLNIPVYAQLDASKQAVWDLKLEEWVKNGTTIASQPEDQKIFWMKQQKVLEAVYQGQFNSKVESAKKKFNAGAFNPSGGTKLSSLANPVNNFSKIN
jgi:ankyrin repeat protein